MFRPALLAIPLAVAACTSAGIAFASDSPARHDRAALAAAPPAGTVQIVLHQQSFQLVDLPPERSGDGPPSPGDESITSFDEITA